MQGAAIFRVGAVGDRVKGSRMHEVSVRIILGGWVWFLVVSVTERHEEEL